MKDNSPQWENKTKFSRRQQIVDTTHSEQEGSKIADNSLLNRSDVLVPKPLLTLADHVTILTNKYFRR